MQSVLYHHGVAQRRDLITSAETRSGSQSLVCRRRRASRSTIAVTLIDAIDVQLAPLGP